MKRGIILAAGSGSRLYPYTKDLPKCLVKLAGKTLLEHQLQSLNTAGINDIIVVGGYKYELLPKGNYKIVVNKFWDTTNMVSSLFCARDYMGEDFIVSYADIIYQPGIVSELSKDSCDIGVVIDKDWLKLWKIRFSNVLSDAESLKLDSDGNIIDIGRKVKDSQEIQGQYIGLLKFSGQGRKDMINFYDRATENEKRQVPVEKFRKMFMTDFLQLLIDANIKIKAVPIKNGWLEIDTKSDYELYLKLYEDNKLSEFIKLG